jgi:4-amino-4-deoxy-L-arabinose transferase-like glycosyltransferase
VATHHSNIGSAWSAPIAALAERAVLPVAVFAWLAFTAWLRPLSVPDEGRYVGVSLEMLWSGNWLTPTLDTLPYFHKPPLFYWMTAASLSGLGINEWAGRMVPLLAATLCALALFAFTRRWLGDTSARITLAVLLTTPLFFGAAQYANLDMLIASCIAGTILCAADAVLAGRDGRPARAPLAGAYLCAALGVLAKGLIGIVIPVMVIGAWLLVTRRPAIILRLVWLPGIAIFALVAVPWFALMQSRYPGFYEYFFVHHHFERYTGGGFNNARPFWFSVAAFAGTTMPWFLVLLIGLVRKPLQPAEAGTGADVRTLMWTWLLSTLLFFSIPPSKLLGYVVAAAPPFALLVADFMIRCTPTQAELRRVVTRMAAIAVLLCAGLLALALARDSDQTAKLAAVIPGTDEVVLLSNYAFSLPFYRRRPPPMVVGEDWDNELLTRKDSWRRELRDAALFDPAHGKRLLLNRADLGVYLACARGSVWVIGSSEGTEAWLASVGDFSRIANAGNRAAWRKTAAEASGPRPACGP